MRNKWTAALDNHEAENPPPIMKTIDGRVIEAGYLPETLADDFVGAGESDPPPGADADVKVS